MYYNTLIPSFSHVSSLSYAFIKNHTHCFFDFRSQSRLWRRNDSSLQQQIKSHQIQPFLKEKIQLGQLQHALITVLLLNLRNLQQDPLNRPTKPEYLIARGSVGKVPFSF